MAVVGVSPSTKLASNKGNIVENTCQCCDILKSELQKAKLDISSYEEIINILLEEQFSSQLKQRESIGQENEEEYVYPSFRKDTAKVSAGMGSNRSNLIQIIPTVNKYEVLANLNDVSETKCNTSESVGKNKCNKSGIVEKYVSSKISKKKGQKTYQKKSLKLNNLSTSRQIILLIGDSHVRNCAKYLQHNLDEDYEVSGFAKPGANMEEIVNTVRKDIQTLKKNDVVILWGGSNDVSKNNTSETIRQLSKFVEEKNEVNLVLMKALPRHDLIPTSCVNSEVLKFNSQMEKKSSITLGEFTSYSLANLLAAAKFALCNNVV